MNQDVDCKVSVIIPIFNNGSELYPVLDAVKSQTHRPCEVIIVNDGSTNGINCRLQESFPEFKLLNLDKNYGVSYARNYGAQTANGEILFFVDSDVILEADTLEKMAEFFRTKDIDIAQATVKSEPGNGRLADILMSNLYNYTYLTREGSFSSNLISYCFAIRKPLFFELGCFDEKYRLPGGEEFHFSSKIASAGQRIYYDRRVTVRHLFKGFAKLTRNLFRRVPLTVNTFLASRRIKNIHFIGEKNHFIYISAVLLFVALLLLFAALKTSSGFLTFLSIFSFVMLNLVSLDFYKYLIKGYGLKKFFQLLPLYYFWLNVMFIAVIKGIWLYARDFKNEP